MTKKRPSRRTPAKPRPRSRRSPSVRAQLPLSDRYDIFVNELAIHDNATQAARAAGYSATSRESLAVTGSRLRKQPEIVRAMAEIRARRIAKQDVDDQELVNYALETMRDVQLKRRERTKAWEGLMRYRGNFGDPIDTRPHVAAFTLPPETPGVRVH